MLPVRHSAEIAFEDAVRRHSRELFRYAYWLTRDTARAEDIVQDTFLRAWSAWNDLRDPAALKGWLYAILVNEHRRRHGRSKVSLESREIEENDLPYDCRFDVAIDMRRALALLPETLTWPLLLQVLGGFSTREIAGLLATSEGAVMTRLTRARQAMRKLCGQDPLKQEISR